MVREWTFLLSAGWEKMVESCFTWQFGTLNHSDAVEPAEDVVPQLRGQLGVLHQVPSRGASCSTVAVPVEFGAIDFESRRTSGLFFC